jgi:hypothetical protein
VCLACRSLCGEQLSTLFLHPRVLMTAFFFAFPTGMEELENGGLGEVEGTIRTNEKGGLERGRVRRSTPVRTIQRAVGRSSVPSYSSINMHFASLYIVFSASKYINTASLPHLYRTWCDCRQIFCVFLFLTGACVFGTIISNTNRSVHLAAASLPLRFRNQSDARTNYFSLRFGCSVLL